MNICFEKESEIISKMSGMSNYGFEVQINGEHLCNAGVNTDLHVVTCILTSLRRLNEPEELDLTISGLNSVTGEHLEWVYTKLKEGDAITIKVITEDFEPARQIRPKISKAETLDNKLRRYHQLREELKEHLE